jgi:opacity protein-like surface antigen
MGKVNYLAKKMWLRFPLLLFIFSLLIVPAKPVFGSDGKKKTEITGYLGFFGPSYLVPGVNVLFNPQGTRPSFGIGYERRLSNRFSLAISFGYAIPSDWYDHFNSATEACDQFYDELGGSSDFTGIWEQRSAFALSAGFYTYFKRGKRSDFFLYFGTGWMRVHERYRMIDNRSSLDKDFSLSDEISTLMDLGLGLKYKLGERYSVRAEWRMHGFIYTVLGDDTMYDSFLVGLSYRF